MRTHTRDKGQREAGARSGERAEKAFEILWTRVIVWGGAAEEWPRKMAGEEIGTSGRGWSHRENTSGERAKR